MAAVLLLGSYLAIAKPESGVMIGQMSALITYGVQVLMSLMMLSMIYVMLTISAESARRICEVLDEVPDMVLSSGVKATDGIFILEHPKTMEFSQHPNFFEHRKNTSLKHFLLCCLFFW